MGQRSAHPMLPYNPVSSAEVSYKSSFELALPVYFDDVSVEVG